MYWKLIFKNPKFVTISAILLAKSDVTALDANNETSECLRYRLKMGCLMNYWIIHDKTIHIHDIHDIYDILDTDHEKVKVPYAPINIVF